eukprot:gene9980-biopygen5531
MKIKLRFEEGARASGADLCGSPRLRRIVRPEPPDWRRLGVVWGRFERRLGGVWETSERRLGGDVCETSGRLGDVWEVSGRRLGDVRGSSGWGHGFV